MNRRLLSFFRLKTGRMIRQRSNTMKRIFTAIIACLAWFALFASVRVDDRHIARKWNDVAWSGRYIFLIFRHSHQTLLLRSG
jgi:hypothetical protein